MKQIRIGIYVILLAAAWIFISFRGGAFPYMIFYTVVALIPTAVFYIIYVHRHIRIYQEIEEHKVTKGEVVNYQLLVENTGFLPVVGMELFFEEELAEMKGIEEKRKIHIMPGEKVIIDSEMICRYAGNYYIGIKAFVFQDAFGLFMHRFSVKNGLRISVRPRITNKAEEALCFENLLNSTEIKSMDRMDNTLEHDLRKYQHGDSFKQIHWKNSAKKHELYVRNPEPADILMITIIMEAGCRSEEFEALKRRDLFLEFAVSTAYYFCKQNKPVTFLYKKASPVLKMVDSYESFYKFYEDIADGVAYRQDNAESFCKNSNFRKQKAGIVLLLREDEFPTGNILSQYEEVDDV